MTAFLIDNMAPIMFAALVIFLLLGYPVAFSLAFVGLGFGALGIYLGLFSTNLLQALPDRIFVIRADQLGRSVDHMYKGAIMPRIVLTLLYMAYVFLMTMVFPKSAPALPAKARSFGEGADYRPVITAIAFPLVLILWGMIVLF